MSEQGAERTSYRFLIAFTGAGYESDAMVHLVQKLEGQGHTVELVSHSGLAAQTAASIAQRGLSGLKSAFRTVTGKLSGDDPLGLKKGDTHDAVVITDPELNRALTALQSETTLRIGLLPRLGWNPKWSDADVDALCVPHPVFRELLLRRGWGEGRLACSGVVLPQSFSRPLDVQGIRGRFGLKPENGPVLMTVCEGVDPQRLERLVFQLTLLGGPAQPIFYVGDDKVAASALRRGAAEYGVRARMFGVVENLEEYYAAADVVLAESSHPLLQAFLALDKPVVLIDESPESMPLAAFLEDEGAAVPIPGILRLGAELDAVLADKERLSAMASAAAKVVDQEGASRTAAALIDFVERRAELVREEESPAETSAEPSTDDPFEMIGAPTAAPTPASNARPTGHQGSGERGAEQPRKSSWDRPSSVDAFERSHVTRMSAAQAKDELAALILMERDVEKRLSAATRFVSQGEGRLDLARNAGESGLVAEAERFLTNYRREEEGLLREQDRIRHQKAKLKAAVRGPRRTPSSGFDPMGDSRDRELEGRFRAMELDRDLNRLKDKVRDDFGDE